MTNQIPTIILKPGKERALLRRHPWVYATGVSKVLGKPKSGETVRIQDSKGKFLAWGAFSPESALRARCWSFQEEDVIDAVGSKPESKRQLRHWQLPEIPYQCHPFDFRRSRFPPGTYC